MSLPAVSRAVNAERYQILKVTARPAMLDYVKPDYGSGRDVGGQLLQRFFPAPEKLDTPSVVVMAQQHRRSAARDIEPLLRLCGRSVGLASGRYASVDGVPLKKLPRAKNKIPHAVAVDPRVDTLVLTAAPGNVLRSGLDLHKCSVAVVLDNGERCDAKYLQAVEVVSKAASCVVVDASSNNIERILERTGDTRVVLIGRESGPMVRPHVCAGGAAVVISRVRGAQRFVVHENRQAHTLPDVLDATASQRTVTKRLAALAVARAVGLPMDQLDVSSVRFCAMAKTAVAVA